tara:strand:+ start:34 stop:1359 length:1326 start_codon:yes stop_codon:yes gene_type:complete
MAREAPIRWWDQVNMPGAVFGGQPNTIPGRPYPNRRVNASPFASPSFKPYVRPQAPAVPTAAVDPVVAAPQMPTQTAPAGLLGQGGSGLLNAASVIGKAGGPTAMPVSLGSMIGPAFQAFGQGVDADAKAARELETYNMAKAAAVAKTGRDKRFRKQYPKLANMPIEEAAKVIVEREKLVGEGPFKSPRWFLNILEQERKNPGSVPPAKLALAKNQYEVPRTFTGPDGQLNTMRLKLPKEYADLGMNTAGSGSGGSGSGGSGSGSGDGSGGFNVETIRPGFDKENQKKLDVSMVNIGKLKASVNQFSDLLDTHGLEVMPGKNRQKMASVYLALLMSLKDFLELGVLAGPDMDIIKGLINDPTALSIETAIGGVDGIKGQLEVLEDMAKRYTGVVQERWGPKGKKQTSPTVKRRQEAMLNKRKIYVKNGKWFYDDTNKAVKQ